MTAESTVIDTSIPFSPDVRQGFEAYVWDHYKYAYGIRPRWVDFSAMPDAELLAWAEELAQTLDAQEERERQREAQDNARIAEVCTDLGIDRSTYDRWMADLNAPEEW